MFYCCLFFNFMFLISCFINVTYLIPFFDMLFYISVICSFYNFSRLKESTQLPLDFGCFGGCYTLKLTSSQGQQKNIY